MTYPDKSGADKAREDFAYWLWVKDVYVFVNGTSLISANTPVTLELAQSTDGVCLKLVAVIVNGRPLTANSSARAPDAHTDANNASIQKIMDTARGRDPRRDALLAARLVVASGPQLNVPSGTRLAFSLAAPLVFTGR